MSAKFISVCIEAQAILADIKCVDMMVASRVWGVVPSVASMLSELDEVDCSNLGCVFMFFDVFFVHAVLIIFQKVFFFLTFLFFFFDSLEFEKKILADFIFSNNLIFKLPLVESSIFRIKV